MTELMESLSDKRTHIGLSRLARFASANGIDPGEIDDTAIENFIAAVRAGSLHRKPNDLHRNVALIWNEVATLPGLHLKPVAVPSFRGPPKRIDWTLLPDSFRTDVEAYLNWCAGSDPFDADAPPRALSSRTLRLRRDQIHAAVTALLESGIKPAAVTSLRDLVSPDAVKGILRRRLEAESGRANSFNRDLGEALVQIAREWAKVDAAVLTELKRLVGKMPMPASGLTKKNKRFLRQFDDPAALRRLFNLPGLGETAHAHNAVIPRASARSAFYVPAAVKRAVLIRDLFAGVPLSTDGSQPNTSSRSHPSPYIVHLR